MSVLETLLDQGFTFRSFPVYPQHMGVEKYHCAALLELSEEGKVRQFSSAGYLLDTGEIALLIERQGKSLFVYKSNEMPAEGDPMENYRRFVEELRSILDQQ